jgi:hypothetical protein
MSIIFNLEIKKGSLQAAQKNVEAKIEREEFSIFLLKMHVEFAIDNRFQYYKFNNMFYNRGLPTFL